jgi:SNF2 family DNA or RNA helicase
VYDELEADLVSKIKTKIVTASNAGVAILKCRQVAAGGLYLDPPLAGLDGRVRKAGPREWVGVHEAKTDALAELVEELEGAPLLVAYEFVHDLARINKALGYEVPYLGGGVNDKEADRLVDLWNADKLPVLLGHPQSIGHGLNLQGGACADVCWFSVTWDRDLYEQFIGRVARPGNKAKRVTNHRLIAKDTVDEDVIIALKNKDRIQQALFNALLKREKR